MSSRKLAKVFFTIIAPFFLLLTNCAVQSRSAKYEWCKYQEVKYPCSLKKNELEQIISLCQSNRESVSLISFIEDKGSRKRRGIEVTTIDSFGASMPVTVMSGSIYYLQKHKIDSNWVIIDTAIWIE